MPINPDAVGTESDPVERSWTSKDALLYAVGVGAGTDELPYVTENSKGVAQQVLPSFAVIAGAGGNAMAAVGDIDWTQLLHGEQAFELAGPIPAEGTVRTVSRISGIWDKGKGAVIETESTSVDATTGEPRFSTRSAVFIRGAGNFGGERGPSGGGNAAPDRAPDVSITYRTSPDQALVYRLSGDRNPLHSDPEFAKLAGFDRPILHGLCTYGFTGRALLHGLCDGDSARFRSMAGRFSSSVYPGDELTVSMWRVGAGEAVFTTATQTGAVVITDGRCTFDE
ncbi:MAG TPA: MaoC/PaaZ C-terminal domain-containing protein [Acidimicrobiales bacterium]|nr:MaoC/PaaZ C-terminal domain-containing protein [Acidimicrobiales bacterium]